MAVGIYIGATTSYSGKNMLALGLGLRFQKEGMNVGYMKPVGAMPTEQNGILGDEDAFFVQDVLGLDNPADKVCPVLVTQDFKVRVFSGHSEDYLPSIRSAYRELAAKHDIVIVAGSGSMLSGRYCNIHGIRLVRELSLKTLVLDRFQKELGYDMLMGYKDALGDQLAGVVLNDIPKTFMAEVEGLISPCLERNGVSVLGVIPHDPLMNAIKVADLAERLNGKIISSPAKSERIVENFLIATMQVENFLTHFQRHKNSAIIVGGDRTDIQLLALEGDCPCLILTGNLYPSDIILTRAEVHNVPIIVVRDGTYAVARKMENILTRHKLRDVVKIRQAAQLVASSFDFQRFKEIAELC